MAGEGERPTDNLFEEKDSSIELVPLGEELSDTSLRELKALLLSIDWEIGDETMVSLITEIDHLKGVLKDDRILVLFFRLLGSVAKYIQSQKANAHPDAIRLLTSIYHSMEKVFSSGEISKGERKKALFAEVSRFRKLKEEIARRKTAPRIAHKNEGPLADKGGSEGQAPHMNKMTPHEAFAYALTEIKQTISAEFQALRAELRLWRDGQ